MTTEAMRTCPSVVGGVEWNGPAVDKLHHALVVGAVDWCADVKKNPAAAYKRGQMFMGGSFVFVTDPAPSGWVTSIDDMTGKVRWKFHAAAPVVSGVTVTAGGLVFFGDMNGGLYALSAADGSVLLKRDTGGAIAGGVITYRMGTEQLVAVTSGNVSRLVWGETGLPSVVIYRRLPDGDTARGVAKVAASAVIEETDPAHGSEVFARTCSACHGTAGEGLTGPAIKGIGARLSLPEIAAWIMSPVARKGASGMVMPTLYPVSMTQQEVFDTAAFVNAL